LVYFGSEPRGPFDQGRRRHVRLQRDCGLHPYTRNAAR
jgi:hypothetical protein